MDDSEREAIQAFREWFGENGGSLNPHISFRQGYLYKQIFSSIFLIITVQVKKEPVYTQKQICSQKQHLSLVRLLLQLHCKRLRILFYSFVNCPLRLHFPKDSKYVLTSLSTGSSLIQKSKHLVSSPFLTFSLIVSFYLITKSPQAPSLPEYSTRIQHSSYTTLFF